jgi:hypothetical protein
MFLELMLFRLCSSASTISRFEPRRRSLDLFCSTQKAGAALRVRCRAISLSKYESVCKHKLIRRRHAGYAVRADPQPGQKGGGELDRIGRPPLSNKRMQPTARVSKET